MNMYKIYKFKLVPNTNQLQLLIRQAGACRWVWNWALEQKIKAYDKETKTTTKIDLSGMLTQLKKQEGTK